MKKEIYRVQVEVGPMEGTDLPDEFLGAFVNVHVPATNIIEAINLAEEYLLADKYRPVQTIAAFQMDLEDVNDDTDEEGYPGNKELNDLLVNGGYWYGPFDGWTSVEEDEMN